MSSYWRVICQTCQARGPSFGRTAGTGMTWNDPEARAGADVPTMADFMIEHEYHELTLEHE